MHTSSMPCVQTERLGWRTYELRVQKAFQVEEIVDEHVVRGKKHMLVRWKNWLEKLKSWVKACDLRNV